MTEKKYAKKAGPRTGMTAEDRARELESMIRMRRAGATYGAIAEEIGISRENVYIKIRDEIRRMPREQVDELRTMEVLRLDHAEEKLQAGIRTGHVPSIRALIALSESRRRLLGLDMPQQHEVKVSREEESLIDQLAEALTTQQNRQAREARADEVDQ